MNVALTALEAQIHISGAKEDRTIPIPEFFLVPGDTPHIETVLLPGELVTHVSLSAPKSGAKSLYLKLRDRASYEFALASAAVVLTLEGKNINHVCLAMGGIGTKPWRCFEAEKALIGRPASPVSFADAAEAELRGARPRSENGFKIELAKRCMQYALRKATELA